MPKAFRKTNLAIATFVGTSVFLIELILSSFSTCSLGGQACSRTDCGTYNAFTASVTSGLVTLKETCPWTPPTLLVGYMSLVLLMLGFWMLYFTNRNKQHGLIIQMVGAGSLLVTLILMIVTLSDNSCAALEDAMEHYATVSCNNTYFIIVTFCGFLLLALFAKLLFEESKAVHKVGGVLDDSLIREDTPSRYAAVS
jgi:hypothetical protein